MHAAGIWFNCAKGKQRDAITGTGFKVIGQRILDATNLKMMGMHLL